MACICDWLVLWLQVCGVAVDPWYGCKAYYSMVTLFLVINTMLQNLSFDSVFRAFAIATNSPEYRFCSSLMPRVEEKDSVVGEVGQLSKIVYSQYRYSLLRSDLHFQHNTTY